MNVRAIPLVNSDLVAYISPEDYDTISCHRWFLKRSQWCSYVCRSIRMGKKVVTLRLHRVIAQRMLDDTLLPRNMDVHHFPDENPLNCTRGNLSLAEHAYHGFITRCLNGSNAS